MPIETVYDLVADRDRFESFVPASFDRFWGWDGRSVAASWSPLRVHVMPEDDGRILPKSDFPGFASNVPVFSQRAAEALAPILSANGELLPLAAPGGVYFAYNVTRVIDALDWARSKVVRLPSGGVMVIERYAFRPEQLTGASIFTIQSYRAHLCVTDAFVQAVASARLTGFLFAVLWRVGGSGPPGPPRPAFGREWLD